MIKLLRSITLLFVLSMGFFSCKTASVMKRHYNKGFYVNKSHSRDDVKSTEQTVRKHTKTAVTAPDEHLAKSATSELKEELTITKPAEEDAPLLASRDDKKMPPLSKSFNTIDFTKKMNPLPEVKSAIAAVDDDTARDALSLLWILLAVLLIVYVAGLVLDLFGLGPIFHILGVIILVLLILWLLRII
ncbi:MAG: hypothetical protein K0R26_2258 [Bacteroidota bacterium]|nr:hypothetical protein [Bacteroidota bacterium]